MKKAISIVVALAMVFVMCIPAFAEGEDLTPVKPTDPTELGVYYAELLNAEGSDPAAVAAEIIADFQAGLITIDNLTDVVTAFAGSVVDETKLVTVLEQVATGLEGLGITLPNFDDVLPPAGEEGEEGGEGNEGEEGGEDELLPDDNTSGGVGDFLNTILGILGSIGDMIFGGGSDTPSDDPAGDNNGDDAWGDEDAEGGDDDGLVPDTGDTTVLSVAAVALVAGAALVLTRKKSEDAE